MKTQTPYSCLMPESWSKDYTASFDIRRQFLFVQSTGYYITAPNYSLQNRSHLHSYLLLYTEVGSGIVCFRNKEITLTPGYAILINCDEPHSYFCHNNQEWIFHWVHFSGSCADGYINEILLKWQAMEMPEGASFFEEINRLLLMHEKIAEIRCSTLLFQMCSDFLIRIHQNEQSISEQSSPYVRNAISYIEEYFTSSMTLDNLSQHVNISKYYLSHIFKQQTGSSPHEYPQNVRITHAKSLLHSSKDSVATIAEKCGFNSCTVFIQAFRKKEGITPLEYRRYYYKQLEE